MQALQYLVSSASISIVLNLSQYEQLSHGTTDSSAIFTELGSIFNSLQALSKVTLDLARTLLSLTYVSVIVFKLILISDVVCNKQ